MILGTRLRGSPSWQGVRSEAGYVHADCSVPDRSKQLADGAGHTFPFVELVFADSAYDGERVANVTCITVQIVRK